MTVLKDDGLYRHLRFKKAGTSFYWFDIVTWPQNLMIRGDMGSFAFSRIEDMFEFFRDSGQDINPGYWSEKLTAPDPRDAQSYSEDKFRICVKQAYDDYVEARGQDDPDVWQRIELEILDSEDCCDESAARDLMLHFDRQVGRYDCSPGFFGDAWEWDLRDWKYQFLWCCYAIQHAISSYDKRVT